MTDEAKRYFTVDEAERLIPQLTALMGRVMECHATTGRVRTALQEAQRRVMLSGGARLEPEFWRSRKVQLGRASGELQAKVGEVLALGGVPKDLGKGLVDFPALLEEREVNLCWRFGEQRIEFWHGLDEGYGARKPLPHRS